MSDHSQGFHVSLHREGNYETTPAVNETANETSVKQRDLIALSRQVLARLNGNKLGNLDEKDKFHSNVQSREAGDNSKMVMLSLVCASCGYRQPFCSCKNNSDTGMVTCNTCKYFLPDTIGSGSGIGCCDFGIEYTMESHGHMPLFRYAERRCDKFERSIHVKS